MDNLIQSQKELIAKAYKNFGIIGFNANEIQKQNGPELIPLGQPKFTATESTFPLSQM